ncbi:AAA family ATPase [bacterium]|nr:AAA family ATPase [bacterium]NCQ55185.1 AAA family ATPase [Candidatus Parcubacteria bacterium]NCS67302.1 AAA family ATPase [Candidatus Peregrinibacteria bacterium]NCS96557.1 AAA family ATPase [bacterium]
MLQATALKILKAGQNVFLTGSAGAGKTYLLNQYIAYLREHGITVAVTASTGIAATHIGGQTIHSWCGLGIKDFITQQDLEKIAKRKPVRDRLQKVQVLVIDEISMLSKDNLAGVNQILQYFKQSNAAFGGIQVIFCGDFFQLPPVSKERRPSFERLAFMSPAWVEAQLQICYLTEQFRAGDSDLINVLNEIRSGDFSDSSQDLLWEKLEQSAEHPPDSSIIKLYTHNADVDSVNAEALKALEADKEFFYATTTGDKTLVETLRKSVLAPDDLVLKVGANVMFVKNNYEAGYMNGTLGTVTGFSKDGWPLVTTFEDEQIEAKPAEWSVVNEFNQPVASYAQVPLRLAWAITVHKSQGMTLDAAAMDLSRTFEPGQGYVALSRVKSWSGLKLLGCNQNALLVDPLVLKADARFQELSDEGEVAFGKIPDDQLNIIFDQFVFRTGGTSDPMQMEFNRQKAAQPIVVNKASKVSTYDQTKVLIKAGKNLTEIATARELSEGTIITHIEKIIKEDPQLDCSALRPDESLITIVYTTVEKLKQNAIEADYDSDGRLKLGLIHRELSGELSYDTLKLILLFI